MQEYTPHFQGIWNRIQNDFTSILDVFAPREVLPCDQSDVNFDHINDDTWGPDNFTNSQYVLPQMNSQRSEYFLSQGTGAQLFGLPVNDFAEGRQSEQTHHHLVENAAAFGQAYQPPQQLSGLPVNDFAEGRQSEQTHHHLVGNAADFGQAYQPPPNLPNDGEHGRLPGINTFKDIINKKK